MAWKAKGEKSVIQWRVSEKTGLQSTPMELSFVNLCWLKEWLGHDFALYGVSLYKRMLYERLAKFMIRYTLCKMIYHGLNF